MCSTTATLPNFISHHAFIFTNICTIERKDLQGHKRLLRKQPVLFTTSNLLLILEPANFKWSSAWDFTLKQGVCSSYYVCRLKSFDERRRFYKSMKALCKWLAPSNWTAIFFFSHKNHKPKRSQQTFNNYFSAAAVTAHIVHCLTRVIPTVFNFDIRNIEDCLRIDKRHSDCVTFTKFFVIFEPSDLDHRWALQLAMQTCWFTWEH